MTPSEAFHCSINKPNLPLTTSYPLCCVLSVLTNLWRPSSSSNEGQYKTDIEVYTKWLKVNITRAHTPSQDVLHFLLHLTTTLFESTKLAVFSNLCYTCNTHSCYTTHNSQLSFIYRDIKITRFVYRWMHAIMLQFTHHLIMGTTSRIDIMVNKGIYLKA